MEKNSNERKTNLKRKGEVTKNGHIYFQKHYKLDNR